MLARTDQPETTSSRASFESGRLPLATLLLAVGSVVALSAGAPEEYLAPAPGVIVQSPLGDGRLWAASGGEPPQMLTAGVGWEPLDFLPEPAPRDLLLNRIVQDPLVEDRLWTLLLGRPFTHHRLLAFDKKVKSVVFDKPFEEHLLGRIVPDESVLWIETDSAVLEVSREGELLREIAVPTGRFGPADLTRLPDGRLLFGSSESGSPKYVLDPASGTSATRFELAGLSIDETSELEFFRIQDNTVLSAGGETKLLRQDGRHFTVPLGINRLRTAGAEGDAVWACHFLPGYRPPKGVFRIDLETGVTECLPVGHWREPGAWRIVTGPDAVWFLFAGGLGRIDPKTFEMHVYEDLRGTVFPSLFDLRHLFADPLGLWVVGKDAISRFDFQHINDHLRPYSDWLAEETERVEAERWPLFEIIEGMTDEEALETLRGRSGELENLIGMSPVQPQVASPFESCLATRATAIASEVERFRRRLVGPELLGRLADYSPEFLMEVAIFLAQHNRIDAVPALRELLQDGDVDLSVGPSQEIPVRSFVNRALVTLGDRAFLESFYETELQELVRQVLVDLGPLTFSRTRSRPRDSSLARLISLGGERLLERQVDTEGVVLLDRMQVQPFAGDLLRSRQPPVALQLGDVVKILGRWDDGRSVQMLIASEGLVGWVVDERLVAELPLRSSAERVRETERLWAEGAFLELVPALRALKLANTRHRPLASSIPSSYAEELVEIELTRRTGPPKGGETSYVHLLSVRDVVGGPGHDVVVLEQTYYYEGFEWNLRLTDVSTGQEELVGLPLLNGPTLSFEDVDGDSVDELVVIDPNWDRPRYYDFQERRFHVSLPAE